MIFKIQGWTIFYESSDFFKSNKDTACGEQILHRWQFWAVHRYSPMPRIFRNVKRNFFGVPIGTLNGAIFCAPTGMFLMWCTTRDAKSVHRRRNVPNARCIGGSYLYCALAKFQHAVHLQRFLQPTPPLPSVIMLLGRTKSKLRHSLSRIKGLSKTIFCF